MDSAPSSPQITPFTDDKDAKENVDADVQMLDDRTGLDANVTSESTSGKRARSPSPTPVFLDQDEETDERETKRLVGVP